MLLVIVISAVLLLGALFLIRSDPGSEGEQNNTPREEDALLGPFRPGIVRAPETPDGEETASVERDVEREFARSALGLALVRPEEVPQGALTRDVEPFRAILVVETDRGPELLDREALEALGFDQDEAFRIADDNRGRTGEGRLLSEEGAPPPRRWSDEFEALFIEHAAASLEKQLGLIDLVGSASFEYDATAGTLTFVGAGPTDHRTCPVQVLGTQSFVSNTWRWGWANAQSDIPERLLKDGAKLRTLGEQLGIEEFKNATFPVDDGCAHALGLIASGLCPSAGYYRAPYGNGALWLLLKEPTLVLPTREKVLPFTMASTFQELVETHDLRDHRAAFSAYVRFHRLEAASSGQQTLEVRRDGAVLMTATFDESSRLTGLRFTAG